MDFDATVPNVFWPAGCSRTQSSELHCGLGINPHLVGVQGDRRDVGRSNFAADRERGTELPTVRVELVAELRCR